MAKYRVFSGNHSKLYFVYALIFLLIGIFLEVFFNSQAYYSILHRRFQERFFKVENEMELRIDNLINVLSSNQFNAQSYTKLRELKDLATKQKIYIFVYRNDSLIFWSDNRIPEAEILPLITDYQQFLQLSNGWFYSVSHSLRNFKIIGLLLIKDNYIIKNQYIQNNFNPIFQLPQNIGVRSNIFKEKYIIKNIHDVNIFSLDFNKPIHYRLIDILFIFMFFCLSIIFSIIGFNKLLSNIENIKTKIILILLFSITICIIYFIFRVINFPSIVFTLQIFNNPLTHIFGTKIAVADLLFITLIIYLVIYLMYIQLEKINVFPTTKKHVQLIIQYFSTFASYSYFMIINYILEKILYKVPIRFNIVDMFSNGMTPLIILLSITFLFSSFLFIVDFIYRNFYKNTRLYRVVLISAAIYIVNLTLYLIFSHEIDFIPPFILLVTIIIIVYLRNYKKSDYKYRHVFLLLVFFSLYLVFTIYRIGNIKLEDVEKEIAVGLADERDKLAESLFENINQKFIYDSTLYQNCISENIDYPWIYKYIRKKYFTGYWERYDLQLTICRSNDSVLIRPDNQLHQCFTFFDSLIQTSMIKVAENFYFFKNPSGRISYFTAYNIHDNNKVTRLFIQLDSRLNNNILGYPQLLISDDQKSDNRIKNYSYAKYHKERIVFQSGNYLYNTSTTKYPVFIGRFHRESFGGYDHLFYRPSKDTLIILSRPTMTLIDLMVSFSYLIIINLLFFNIMLLLANYKQYNYKIFQGGFGTRIQLTIISILLISLIFVAGITIYFTVEQYSKKYYESFGEKLQSVYLELYSNLSTESKLTYIWHSDEYSNLESLLRHLSNLFATDIHLYNTDGRLLATSRSEIFEKGLIGNIINPYAFYQLSKNNKIEFVQNERLGKQKYFSIYTPLVNKAGNIIAYINLPYFTQQDKLSNEITSILLAIINIYLIIIIIAISTAVVIARKLTRPLQIIQESIAQMRLGKGNVKIRYKGNDEIANLIHEYNKKVEELEHSAELLSKTERELAWREMAKQVAHEIKNPLTPMKLSIQQLQRRFAENKQIDEQYITRITQTLIEQIDNLSSIASAFSQLAQMPKPKKEKIEINSIIKTTCDLFKTHGIHFHLNLDKQPCYIIADKEQLQRVFINLITNAVQAVETNDEKIIRITSKLNNKLIIEIEDNGIGVDPEKVNKLFQPNFTTKSSGSGLGLAISKSIIEYIGGSISYEPAFPKGSRFIIKLPADQALS